MSGPNDDKLVFAIQPDSEFEIIMYVPSDDGITRAPETSFWRDFDGEDPERYYSAADGTSAAMVKISTRIKRRRGRVIGHDDDGNEIVAFEDVTLPQP